MQPNAPAQSNYQVLRRLLFIICGTLLAFLAVAILLQPASSVSNVGLLAGAAAIAVATALGALVAYRTRLAPLSAGLTGEEARQRGLVAYRMAIFTGFAIAEAGALLGFALVQLSGSWIAYLPGLFTALGVLLGVLLPTRDSVQAAQARLDANGARSDLSASMGL
jgi:hypothetical protein